MANVFDVAAYLLHAHGPMTTMKLQKLVYYCQAWSIVWDDERLFPERILAFDNGPVVRELWDVTRPMYRVERVDQGDPSNLSDRQKETIDKVLEFYGDKDAQWLSDLTHMESPWKEAREQGQNTEITLDRMSEYYSSLTADEQKAS